MDRKLVKYDEVSQENYMDYISEWEIDQEKVIPGGARREGRSFPEMMIKWKREETEPNVSKGYVPATMYFLTEVGGRILGAIQFRHYLNEQLLQDGGHIGYGVRKSERQKGCAHEMLSQLLERIKGLGIDKVLITCDDDNIGSARTIESCNGILENKVLIEDELTRRYWIELK